MRGVGITIAHLGIALRIEDFEGAFREDWTKILGVENCLQYR